MSDTEDEDEEEPSPSPALILFPDGSSYCQTQPFLSTQKVPASADDDFLALTPYIAPLTWRKSETEEAGIQTVDRKVQQFWRPWEDEQEDQVRGKTKSDTGSDILAGQNTATQTLLCYPPGQLNRRGWKRRRSQRDLVRRRER